MTSHILVTGGTGTLGRLVTPLLRESGFSLRLLSRHSQTAAEGIEYVTGDLFKDEGIEKAVDGAEIVVHLAGGPKGDDEATRNLMRAAAKAGVQHVVYISVIGADRVPLSWLKSKLDAERAIADSGVPWTTLRAAQFHDLTLTMVSKMAKLPVVPVPGGLRLQPVDARDVAAKVAELAFGQPSGLVADIAGPAVYPIGDLIRGYLRAAGKRRPMLPVRIPGKAGRAYRAGDNLTLEGATLGTHTWEAFLGSKLQAAE
jgi:uncharacterized protein YbjT (DUF2867 family)